MVNRNSGPVKRNYPFGGFMANYFWCVLKKEPHCLATGNVQANRQTAIALPAADATLLPGARYDLYINQFNLKI